MLQWSRGNEPRIAGNGETVAVQVTRLQWSRGDEPRIACHHRPQPDISQRLQWSRGDEPRIAWIPALQNRPKNSFNGAGAMSPG